MNGATREEPVKRRFGSILVANRGEIACRVLRSAKDLGYRTIAVYSEADRQAPHVDLADEAAQIGPAPARDSYLNLDRILDAAARTGADAIHPGYGFLAENAQFAQACRDSGYVFIGPPAGAIELMGNKAAAKRRMNEAGVPCVPGYHGQDQDDETLVAAALGIGLPVMVKAAAGGGGRGMRLARSEQELVHALRLARSEALSGFGSDELILEKALARPRHVEIQVFADHHGNVIHLGERDCSVQRRHQKVLEEAPCPIMNPELRARMGVAAVEAARSIGYVGAGTVEFLLDESDAFWFLEMNTRLQVEHPVTELVTGIDLVALQISVAQGDRLPVGQADVTLTGHAIEVRLYAEDPAREFLPGTGRIEWWRRPSGEGIRVDDGIRTGVEISPYYDAMVAKIIAWGPDREVARRRLLQALQETALFGLPTNRDFLIGILRHEDFAAGRATTAFIAERAGDLAPPPEVAAFQRAAAAAVLTCRAETARSVAAAVRVSRPLLNWSSSGALTAHFLMSSADGEHRLTVIVSDGRYRISDPARECAIEVLKDNGSHAELVLDGAAHRVLYLADSDARTWMALGDRSECYRNRLADRATGGEAGRERDIAAPMHGLLREVCVSVGERVTRGQRLLVLEAMKMQHEVLACVDGVVASISREAGGQVAAGELILEIEPAPGEE